MMETQEQHLLNEALRSIEALRADLRVLDARVKALEADALSDETDAGTIPPGATAPYAPSPAPIINPWPYTQPWNPFVNPTYYTICGLTPSYVNSTFT
jgi:hypothetical protein